MCSCGCEALNSCEFQTFRGNWSGPPEYCDRPQEPGSEFCALHQDEDPELTKLEDRADSARKGE